MKVVRGTERDYCWDTVVVMDMNEYHMLQSMLHWFLDNNKTPYFARTDIIKRMYKVCKK